MRLLAAGRFACLKPGLGALWASIPPGPVLSFAGEKLWNLVPYRGHWRVGGHKGLLGTTDGRVLH